MTGRTLDDRRSAPRVLHATECLATGTLQVLRVLTRVLHHRGVEQTVLYSRKPETPDNVLKLFDPAIRFVEVEPARGTHGRFIVDLSRKLRQEVRGWRPQLVHLHSSKAGFVGRLALRGLEAMPKVLYSPHGLSFLDDAKPLKSLVFRRLEQFADVPFCKAVGCGRGEAELLEALYGRSAALLENPVDEAFFGLQREPQPTRLVVTAGRICRQKAPETFAAIARAVRSRDPSVRMVWIGDGEPQGRASLLQSGCEVTGWKSRDEVMAWVAKADVYLQTSRWEGLPISVIQAMAAATPCVVTDVVGNRDAVTDGETGFVASDIARLAERVSLLLEDAELRARLGRAARAEALARFSEAAFAANVERLYELGDSRSSDSAIPAVSAIDESRRAVSGLAAAHVARVN
jgi:glycosyltransferase involved in cell wall biosynthesis